MNTTYYNITQYKERNRYYDASLEEYINNCLWSLSDYDYVKMFLRTVQTNIHAYGAYTLFDLKNELLLVEAASCNEELGSFKYEDGHKGWVNFSGFDFEIVDKDFFKIIIPWDSLVENLDEYFDNEDLGGWS